MMGERLVMQESLFYAVRREDHVPCDHLLKRIASSTAPGCASTWRASTAPSADPRLIPS
jgi:hypothetical protein